MRPQTLVEPGPLRTVEQLAELDPMVLILDALVPQVVLGRAQDQLLQRIVEQFLMDDTEQVIEVPMITCPARPPLRAVLAATQMAEQLVKCQLCPRRLASSMLLCRRWESVDGSAGCRVRVRGPAAFC